LGTKITQLIFSINFLNKVINQQVVKVIHGTISIYVIESEK